MIIDKQSKPRGAGDRRQETGDRHYGLASRVSRLASRVSLRRRWVRLLLLVLAVGALAVTGSTIGRGFNSGAAVLSQAVGPTIAAAATPAPPPVGVPTMVATAAPAPAVSTVPTTAAPAPSQLASVEEPWPQLAEEHFDGVSERWPEVRSSPSWSSRYQDGGYLMQVDSRPGISYSGPLRSRDFWYAADVRLTRGQAGLFFLIGRPNDFYRLLIDTEGRYQLEWQQVGVSQPLIAWTTSDALQQGENAINQIAVRRSGDELTLYANGVLLASYALPAGNTLESRIGLALDAPEGGRNGVAWFDNLVVRAPKQ